MSIAAIQAVWDRSQSTGTARVVLLAIADHADEHMTAYPSLTRLAHYANVHRRSAIRAIQSLVELGELVRVDRGKQGVTVYRMALPGVPTSDDSVTSTSDARVTSDASVTGDNSVTQLVTNPAPTSDTGVTQLVTPVSPEPSMNHQEPSVNRQGTRARATARPAAPTVT